MAAETCAVRLDNGVPPTIRLRGDVQSEASREIAGAFREVMARGCESVYLDAAGVTGIDDRGLQALIESVQAAEARGVAVELTRAGRCVRMALRRSGAGTPHRLAGRGWDVDLALPRSPKSVAVIRGHVAEMARRMPFSVADAEDIVLAVGEAAANAVRHGARAGEADRLKVRCRADQTGFSVEITDPGEGFDPGAVRMPNARQQRPGGLGIYLMRRIMDEVSFTFDARGTTVRLVKRA